jgi:hypothetical protein
LKRLERVWKVRVKGVPGCQESFRVKARGFWRGSVRLRLKTFPFAREVLKLQLGASG